jgi:hypothetical protein
MSEHFIKYCKNCGIVMEQCRCPMKDKTIKYGICDKCKKKENDSEKKSNKETIAQ